MTKIGILSIIQILFIIISFGVLIYLQSQQTLLGNTINIAGKNRYLTSNLLYQVSDYKSQSFSQLTIPGEKNQINYKLSNNSISKIKSAEQQIDSNMMALKNGGNVSNIQIQSIPSEFINTWNIVYQKWINLKSLLNDNLYNNSSQAKIRFDLPLNSSSNSNNGENIDIIQKIYPLTFDLINSSDTRSNPIRQF